MRHEINISSAEQFIREINLQKQASMRGDHQFSLVVFLVEDTADSGRELSRIAAERLRILDVIGWFDHQEIGLLLPYTSSEGALEAASSILQSLKRDGDIRYFVYSHPSRTFIDMHGDSDQRDLDDLLTNCATQRHQPDEKPTADALGHGHESASTAPKTLTMQQEFQLLGCDPLPWWKRVMDIAGALVCLVLLSPFILLTSIAVKIDSKGPIMFKHERIGRGMKPFLMYKFRSMTHRGASNNPIQLTKNGNAGPFVLNKTRNDSRITKVGGFIRKWSLDELPQIWNVVMGDMSLVGPRPLVREEAEACTRWHALRFRVKPGLTCIWQVNGRSEVGAEERSRMDLRYILSVSFLEDFKLLLLTPWAVFSRKGAH